MTITAERAAIRGTCKPGVRHAETNTAWNMGCRCAGAIEAHGQWIAMRKAMRAQARAAASAGADCPAGSHDTLYAYENSGCRCLPARRAYRLKNNGGYDETWRAWNRWRGPKTRVDRLNLMFLTDGVATVATQREKMLAIEELDRRRVVNGPYRWRRMSNEEIGIRLGLSEASVHRIRGLRVEAARRRAERRLSDLRWKAARAEMARGRKERVAAEHQAAHERKDGLRERRGRPGSLVPRAARWQFR